jgi:hypothetical protein
LNRYVFASVENFRQKNIDISTARKSLNGAIALKHIELLTDNQFNSIRFNENFEFRSEGVTELLQSSDWIDEIK